MVALAAPAVTRCSSSGKVCYARVAARLKAKQVRRATHERVSEYHCARCGWWHYGHTPHRVVRRGHRVRVT